MDIMGRILAGTEKEPAYPIKGPAFLTPWFSLRYGAPAFAGALYPSIWCGR